MPAMPSPRQSAAIAAALYLALALAVTWPLLLVAGSHVTGGAQSDVWAHLWGFWRTEKALFVEHALPYQEGHLNHPYGGSLYHVDLLNSLFMLPLSALFGRALGYNLLLWGQLVAGGLAMFLLARRFVQRAAPAFLAGVGFAFCSYLLSFPLASGVSERLNIVWIPLFFLAFVRILDRARPRWFLLAGLSFLLATLGCWKFGLFLYMLSCAFSLYLLLRLPLARWLSKEPPRRTLGRALAELVGLKLLPLALVCALAAAPLALLAAGSVQSEGAILPRISTILWDGQASVGAEAGQLLHETNLFTVWDFFSPSTASLRVTHHHDLLYQGIYLGLGLALLAAVSLVSRVRWARFFFPAALLFAVLSQGPWIVFGEGGAQHASWLYFAVARAVPFFTAMHAPWEYSLLTAFCLSLGAALGLDLLLARLQRPRLRSSVGWSVAVLVSAELLLVNPAPVPVPLAEVRIPSFYQQLAREQGEFAVFDFPPQRADTGLVPETYFLYQTVHKRPIPYGINECWLTKDAFWNQLVRLAPGQPLPRADQEEHALEFLAEHSFRYFVLHKENVRAPALQGYLAYFGRIFGQAVHEDEQLVAYRVPGT